MLRYLRTVAALLLIIAVSAGAGTLAASFLATPAAGSGYIAGDYAEQRVATGADVVLMGTEWCPYCAQTREYLGRRGVSFTELDIEKSEQAYRWVQALQAPGVPVLLIGDRQIRGFRPEAIDAALEALAASPRG